MQRKWIEFAVLLIAIFALGGIAAGAQTDVAGSFYATLNGGTKTGNGTVQTSPNSEGGLMEIRHIQKNPLIGYELFYSYNLANQTYAPETGNCGYQCGNSPETVKGNTNQTGLAWVPTMKVGNLRPFAVAGFGFYINTPSKDIGYLNTAIRPMWVYGAGVDWGFLPRAGLRLQYRGEMYKDPNLDDRFNTTGAFIHASMPLVGFYFTL
ncbi:MAG: outer membrane beta-barrel protein [Terracidiphilus sp.]